MPTALVSFGATVDHRRYCAVAAHEEIGALIEELSENAYPAARMKDAESEVWRLAPEGGVWGQIQAQEQSGVLVRLLRRSANP